MRPFTFGVPFMSTPGFNPHASSPGYTPGAFGGWPGAAPPPRPGVVAPENSALFGYEDPRKRAIMATAASLLESGGPSTTRTSVGASIGKAMNAGALARAEQQQLIEQARNREQNRAYLEAQMRTMEEARLRRQAIEQAAGSVKVDPNATPEEQARTLRQAAGALFAAGDFEGGMDAMQKADQLYNPLDVRAKEAQIGASEAAAAASRRGPQPRYDYQSDAEGNLFMVREGDTTARPVTGPDGKPLRMAVKGDKDTEVPKMTQPEIQNAATQLQKYRTLYSWLSGGGATTLGSPMLGSMWDRTYGRATGSHDFARQREMDRVVSGAILIEAKNMKGALSDRDVRFLEGTQPKKDDPVDMKLAWLAELHNRVAFNLSQNGYTVEQIGEGSTSAIHQRYGLIPKEGQ